MRRGSSTPTLLFGTGLLAMIIMFLALAIVSRDPSMVGLVLGGSGLLAFAMTASPVAALLGWLVTQPTIEGTLFLTVGPLPALTADRVLLVALVLWLGGRWISRRSSVLPLGRIDAAMALLLSVITVSALIKGGSHHPYDPRSGLGRDLMTVVLGYGIPFAGFLVAKNFVQTRRDVSLVMHTLIAVGVIVSSLGLLGYFFELDLFAPTRYLNTQEDRARGSLTSGAVFGAALIIPAVMAFIASSRARHTARRLIYFASLCVILGGIMFSKTRSSWLALLLSLSVVGVLDRQLRRRLLGLVLVGALAAPIVLVATGRSTEFRRRATDVSPALGRLVALGSGLNIFVRNPLFGVGYGQHSYAEAIPDHLISVAGIPPSTALWGVPHNQYVHLLAITGLSGFLPFLAILIFTGTTGRRAWRHPREFRGLDRDVPLVLMAGLASFAVNNLFQDSMQIPGPNNNQLFVLLGIVEGFRMRSILAGRPEKPAQERPSSGPTPETGPLPA